MTKLIFLSLFFSTAHCWVETRKSIRQDLRLGESSSPADRNPCWQDLYDDDCSMESVFQASFVASQWIKSMPCAAGIEDCDMPEGLTVPGNRQEAGKADKVDVASFLNLKRAEPIHIGKSGSTGGNVAP